MRRLLTLFVALLSAMTLTAQKRQPLDEGWQFCRVGDSLWRSAQVPGTVHQDLLDHGLIPDPFYGTNEALVQWVEDEDWTYRLDFDLSAEDLCHDGVRLCFDGLDTYADIWLNGHAVASVQNMFVGYAYEVKNWLKPGTNRLEVRFRSPIREVMPMRDAAGFDYPADNDHHPEKTSVYTRKAPYSYGWDMQIRLVTCGIWKPAYLEFWRDVRIEDYYVRVLQANEQEARVSRELQWEAARSGQARLYFDYALDGKTLGRDSVDVSVEAGLQTQVLEQVIRKPKLWMPHGWGEATLYDFTAQIRWLEPMDPAASFETKPVDRRERVGLREVKLVQDPDSVGVSFYFQVNGRPLFAKGANMMPGDALLPRMDAARYRRVVDDALAAGFNMIRHWGGGIYESDDFYELADESGLLVWQDFLFGCTTYPADSAFLANVRAEAEYNLRRLRRHPCLVLWCGNNEVEEGIKYWGWKRRFSPYPGVYEQMQADYDRLFRELLPEVVAELDPQRPYLHGSPLSANWGRPDSWTQGDAHNWGLWYGQKPFESMDNDRFRFVSEYGFQAFPEMKTVTSFATEADYDLNSEVMRTHQKASTGNGLIKKYLEMYYPVPEDFPTFVYAVQVLQGQGMRDVVEAHRRHRPYCMGSLYWQFNEAWPTVSWASVDYYGNWKALHYQMRRAYAPEVVIWHEQAGLIQFYAASDRLEDRSRVRVTVQTLDSEGKVLHTWKRRIRFEANSTVPVFALTVDELLGGRPAEEVLIRTRFETHEGADWEHLGALVKPKQMSVPRADIRMQVEATEGCWTVTLESETLARDVFLEIPLQGLRYSDNFFDLYPGEPRVIVLKDERLPATETEGPALCLWQLADVFPTQTPLNHN